jgi:hypothetical protein
MKGSNWKAQGLRSIGLNPGHHSFVDLDLDLDLDLDVDLDGPA